MDYQIMPIGKPWENGMFSVPKIIAENYIKLASEYQLKALLLILSNGGKAKSREIAKTLGCTENDAVDFLEFWVSEGILIKDSTITESQLEKSEANPEKEEPKQEKEAKKSLESIPVPTLSPNDVKEALRDNQNLQKLVQAAQEVFGRTISHNEEALIVNMVQYYGLPGEIVLTILQYYKSEKDKGRAIGIAYLGAMAKNWSEEGITTLCAAEDKLRELENSNRIWREILAACSIQYRNPSANQRKKLQKWLEDFNLDMIFYACEIMCENADKPGSNYLSKILENWKKKGITSLEQAKADNDSFREKKDKEKEKSGKLKGAPSFDINEIEKKALFDDDYNI